MKKVFGIIGGLIVALALVSAAQAAVVTVSCSPSNSPANPILNSSSANLASGAFVQVIDNTSGSVSAPKASDGSPTSGGSVISTGTLSSAGTFVKSGVSVPTGHYIYIVAWETWNGSGTPTGNYGISTISAAMSGVSFTYKPASFSTVTPIAPVSLSSATPSSGMQGATLTTVAIVGTNTHFTASSSVSFGSNITVGSVTYTDATHVTANNVVIAAGAATGSRSVSVTTGSETATGNIFTVTAAPVATVTGISPNSGNQGQTLDVVITGSNTSWSGTMTSSVAFSGSGITVNSATATDATHITANITIAAGATTGSRSVTVTGASGSASFTVNAVGTATLTGIAPSSGNQGQTLDVVLSGSNTAWSGTMTSSVIFSGSGITVNSATASTATSITANITIASTASTGARSVSVTGTSGTVNFNVTASSTTPATSITIDDYEGAAGNSSNNCSSYYTFAYSSASMTANRITTGAHTGYSMDSVYSTISDPTNAWRGFGGILVKTLDLSGYSDITVWVKGDGSANTLKFQVKDADGTNFAVSDADAIPLSSTDWTEYRITGFQSKMTRVTGTTSGDATLDWTKVTEYQFVFAGTAASTGVLIDDVIATNTTTGNTPHITSITPTSGGEKITVTITGSNFMPSGVTGGSVNFAGGGATTSVKSSDTNTLITSWTDTQIVMSLPGMGKGTKTVNVIRSDSVASDNTVTFEVTSTATGGAGVTYNYPNPFDPLRGDITNIVFTPGSAQNGTIQIYDMAARQINRIDWTNTGGTMTVQWDGKNNYNEIVGDGVYLYRIVDSGNGKLINKGKILVINK